MAAGLIVTFNFEATARKKFQWLKLTEIVNSYGVFLF